MEGCDEASAAATHFLTTGSLHWCSEKEWELLALRSCEDRRKDWDRKSTAGVGREGSLGNYVTWLTKTLLAGIIRSD